MEDFPYNVFGLPSLKPPERCVLLALDVYERTKGAGASVALAYLGGMVGLASDTTVSRALHELERAGYVTLQRAHGRAPFTFQIHREKIRRVALSRWSDEDKPVNFEGSKSEGSNAEGSDIAYREDSKSTLREHIDPSLSSNLEGSDFKGSNNAPLAKEWQNAPDPFGARFHAERVERQQQRREQNKLRVNLATVNPADWPGFE